MQHDINREPVKPERQNHLHLLSAFQSTLTAYMKTHQTSVTMFKHHVQVTFLLFSGLQRHFNKNILWNYFYVEL